MNYEIDVRYKDGNTRRITCQQECNNKNAGNMLALELEASKTVLGYRILPTYHRKVRLPKVRI